MLQKAEEFVKNLGATGKIILFVGTKPEAKDITKNIAISLNMPYVSERWVGGALTNFPEIKKRITKLLDLRDQKEKGGLDKYTKKERLLIDREMDDMTKNFQGLTGITKTPDAMFVIDPKKEKSVVKEALDMKISVIALSGSDCDIRNITYPIPANDASQSSAKFFTDEIVKAYNAGKLEGRTETKEVKTETKKV